VYSTFTFGGEPKVEARLLRHSQQVLTFDITKAREGFGVKPRVGIEDRFRRGVNWHLQQEKK
jgi:sterol-4alpha-carboxylate 3-dehydrogenase (decarboxylating)